MIRYLKHLKNFCGTQFDNCGIHIKLVHQVITMTANNGEILAQVSQPYGDFKQMWLLEYGYPFPGLADCKSCTITPGFEARQLRSPLIDFIQFDAPYRNLTNILPHIQHMDHASEAAYHCSFDPDYMRLMLTTYEAFGGGDGNLQHYLSNRLEISIFFGDNFILGLPPIRTRV